MAVATGRLQRSWRQLCLLLAFCCLSWPALSVDSPLWIEALPTQGRQVHLYFFWSATCPHCHAAQPQVAELAARYPWLIVHSQQLAPGAAPALAEFERLAAATGVAAEAVPAFFFCGRAEFGFDRPETNGRALAAALLACHENGLPAAQAKPAPLQLPVVGAVDPARWSLPVLTLVLGGLDAFNPCAFFVLLFLLSLLVHAGSRRRMLFIGGVYLFFSGAIYFLFMAAWLNIFRWLGEIALVTTGAGMLALLIGAINIKDYFWFKRGVSLSIPAAAKPGLYQRVRGLLRADSLPALLLGTVALALAANAYELLCTVGFPMVYTRLLTLADLPPAAHYLWLLAYNLIYVLPLLAITLVFTFTLGARKLSAVEGRLLKLLSGLMMVGLGGLLLIRPEALNDLRVALALPLAALAVTGLLHLLSGRARHD